MEFIGLMAAILFVCLVLHVVEVLGRIEKNTRSK